MFYFNLTQWKRGCAFFIVIFLLNNDRVPCIPQLFALIIGQGNISSRESNGGKV